MPREKKVTREEILRAAAEVVRTEGKERLSVRGVAGVIGCSTQPVYSCFAGGIAELERALYEAALGEYRARIEGYLMEQKYPQYMAYGMGFVRFAREEKGLFRYLFFSEREEVVLDPLFDDIADVIAAAYHTDVETARSFHTDMAIFSYGLGALVNTGHPMSEEEVAKAFQREFFALYGYYFPDRPKFWLKGGA